MRRLVVIALFATSCHPFPSCREDSDVEQRFESFQPVDASCTDFCLAQSGVTRLRGCAVAQEAEKWAITCRTDVVTCTEDNGL